MAIKKSVSFKDEEIDMVKHADSQLSFSIYVKTLIKRDMEESKEGSKSDNLKRDSSFGLDF